MAYITRNTHGKIEAVYEKEQYVGQEYLSIDNPELIAFINQSVSDNEIKSTLSSSDIDLIRVLDDLVYTLIDKKVILFTDLPSAAQKKLANREKVRGQLNSLDNLMSDDEGIL